MLKWFKKKEPIKEKTLKWRTKYRTEVFDVGQTTVLIKLDNGIQLKRIFKGIVNQYEMGYRTFDSYNIDYGPPTIINSLHYANEYMYALKAGVQAYWEDDKTRTKLITGQLISAEIIETIPYNIDYDVKYSERY